jgi:hydrogenase/urease accessory protein HupE
MSPFKTVHSSLAHALVSGIALQAGTAWAHPGDHGHDFLHALMHMLTEPDHLAGIAIVILIAAFGLRRWRKAAASRA